MKKKLWKPRPYEERDFKQAFIKSLNSDKSNSYVNRLRITHGRFTYDDDDYTWIIPPGTVGTITCHRMMGNSSHVNHTSVFQFRYNGGNITDIVFHKNQTFSSAVDDIKSNPN